MLNPLNTLELRNTHISLKRCGEEDTRQHKGIAKAIAKHLNKVLPAKAKIVIPENALSIVIDRNCIVKFYVDHKTQSNMDKYKPNVVIKGGKVYWSDYSWQWEKKLASRRNLHAVRMIKGGKYKIIDLTGYVRSGDFAARSHLKHGESLEVDSVNRNGEGFDSDGQKVLEKGMLKFTSLVGYK